MPHLFESQIQQVALGFYELISLERFAFKNNLRGLVGEACHFEGLDQLRDLLSCLPSLTGTRHAGFVEGQERMRLLSVLLALLLAVDYHFSGAAHDLRHIDPKVGLGPNPSVLHDTIAVVGVRHEGVFGEMIPVDHGVLV